MIYIAGSKPKKQIDAQGAERSLQSLEARRELMFGAENVSELRGFASLIQQKMLKNTMFLNRRYIHRIDENEIYYNITRTR